MNNMRTWTHVQITILSKLANIYYPFLAGQAHPLQSHSEVTLQETLMLVPGMITELAWIIVKWNSRDSNEW